MKTLDTRRLGRFTIARILIDDPTYTAIIASVFSRIKVLDARYDNEHLVYRYVGECELFDEIAIGEKIPSYELTFDSQTNEMAVRRQEDTMDIIGREFFTLRDEVATLSGTSRSVMVSIAELTARLSALEREVNLIRAESVKRTRAKAVSTTKKNDLK